MLLMTQERFTVISKNDLTYNINIHIYTVTHTHTAFTRAYVYAPTQVAVSYTHLDVYKRQVL